jgi:hypothetical protein
MGIPLISEVVLGSELRRVLPSNPTLSGLGTD